MAIGIGAAIATSYNEPNEDSGEITPEGSPEGSSESQEFTITLEEKMGVKEPSP